MIVISRAGQFNNVVPRTLHVSPLKRVMRYLCPSASMRITYGGGNCSNILTAYCDSDFAMDQDNRKSRSRFASLCLMVGDLLRVQKGKPPLLIPRQKLSIMLHLVHRGKLSGYASYLATLAFHDPILRYWLVITNPTHQESCIPSEDQTH